MIRYQWLNSYKREITEPNVPTVKDTNAEWILFQIGREIQISKFAAEDIKSKYRTNWILPDTLKETFYNLSSFSEADLYEIIMDTFLKFVTTKEIELRNLKYGKMDDTITFVKSIIHTKIKIEDTDAIIYTNNEKLVKVIKEAVKNERYNIRTVSSET